MIFKNSKVYDCLKWLASPGLPAVATLLVAASQIWNLQVLALIGATVAAVATCFGEWTGKSSKVYWAAQNSGGDFGDEEDEDEVEDPIEEDSYDGEQDSDE